MLDWRLSKKIATKKINEDICKVIDLCIIITSDKENQSAVIQGPKVRLIIVYNVHGPMLSLHM